MGTLVNTFQNIVLGREGVRYILLFEVKFTYSKMHQS